MASATTNYNIPYPLGSDPLSIPYDIRAVALAVDSSLFTVDGTLQGNIDTLSTTVTNVQNDLNALDSSVSASVSGIYGYIDGTVSGVAVSSSTDLTVASLIAQSANPYVNLDTNLSTTYLNLSAGSVTTSITSELDTAGNNKSGFSLGLATGNPSLTLTTYSNAATDFPQVKIDKKTRTLTSIVSDEVIGSVAFHNNGNKFLSVEAIAGATASVGSLSIKSGVPATEKVIVNSTGNVGIGTSTPTEKLHVSGNVVASGMMTASAGMTVIGNLSATTITTTSGASFTDGISAGTPVADNNSTQVATTAWVMGQAANVAPAALGSVNIGSATRWAKSDHVHPTTGLGLTANALNQFAATTSAQLASIISDETGSGALVFATSPTLAGTPLAPTAAVDTNTTQVATTAFVVGQGYLKQSSASTTYAVVEQPIIFNITNEADDITAGSSKYTVRAPYAMTLTRAPRAVLTTESSSGSLIFDINVSGSSIFTTALTIDQSEKSSATAAVPAVLGITTIADDAELTFDVDSAGTGAKGLKIILYHKRT